MLIFRGIGKCSLGTFAPISPLFYRKHQLHGLKISCTVRITEYTWGNLWFFPNQRINDIFGSNPMTRSHFRTLLIASLAWASVCSFAVRIGFAQDAEVQPEPLVQPTAASPSDLTSKTNSLNHHQWLRLSPDGSFWGTLGTPAGESQIRQSGVDIALCQNGQIIAQVTTAEDGSFRFVDVKPGVYSLVAQNPSTLAVMSVSILDSAAGKHLPGGIQVRTLTPATERVVSLVRSGSVPRARAEQEFDKDPAGQDRTFWNSGRIAIDQEGGIRGRVSVPSGNTDLSGTSIYLTHSGNEVARTRADRDGNYRFDNIPPGNYGFVASGPAGIAALGFVAVGQAAGGGDASTSISEDGRKFVRAVLQQDSVPGLNVELASCDCMGAPLIAQTAVPLEEACCPLPMAGCCGVAGGNFGGGGGGGGIGGGFGGGLLPLALIGGLTAIGIELAKDDDKSNVVVSPVVP